MAALPVCAFVGAFAACASGERVPSATVQRAIDQKIVRALRARDPNATIAPSRCPDPLELAPQQPARCTLTVDGVALPILVEYAPPPHHFTVRTDGTFYEPAEIAGFIERSLFANYGLTVKAHCPGKKVELLMTGTFVDCTVAGTHALSSVHISVLERGLYLPPTRGLKPAKTPTP
jgi:hypothetical protein